MALTKRMAHSPTYSVDQAIEEIRDFYQFDYDTLVEQKLRQIVLQCARKVRTRKGRRAAYVVRNEVINLNLCKDEERVNEVRKRMEKQINGYRDNYRGVLKRLIALTGQITIDDLFKDMEEENRTKEA